MDVVGGVKKSRYQITMKVFKGIGNNVAEGFADGIEGWQSRCNAERRRVAEVAIETVGSVCTRC